MFTLSQKEKSLLNELLQHEELCIQKYTNYALKAQDPQLTQLFQNLAQKEQQHYDSVDTLLQGEIPQGAQQGGGQQDQSQQSGQSQSQGQQNQQSQEQGSQNEQQSQGMQNNQQENMQSAQQQGSIMSQHKQDNQSPSQNQQNNPDSSLLEDMLMTEKYISSYYDTAVFEMSNSEVRQVLQHIQQEEQQHGEEIYNYMSEKGLYN
ncbi:spore coat protein [Proteinivorax tanatarense]|uniref:Spore coat protein n=1 Tax=Proteinivorax tanatarense TaxID=1260629 RepID=A0AAU7VJ11_9FIRM